MSFDSYACFENLKSNLKEVLDSFGTKCIIKTSNNRIEKCVEFSSAIEATKHVERYGGFVYDGELIATVPVDTELTTGELYRFTTGLLHRGNQDKTAIKFFIFESSEQYKFCRIV